MRERGKRREGETEGVRGFIARDRRKKVNEERGMEGGKEMRGYGEEEGWRREGEGER